MTVVLLNAFTKSFNPLNFNVMMLFQIGLHTMHGLVVARQTTFGAGKNEYRNL